VYILVTTIRMTGGVVIHDVGKNPVCVDKNLIRSLSQPVFKDKTECITICMPGSSSIHIVTSLVNNQQ
jgi:hypothetical protein